MKLPLLWKIVMVMIKTDSAQSSSNKKPFINYGPRGSWRKIRGASQNKSLQGGGLPTLFRLMGGALKKINLFHQIIRVKETNIVEYLVLM